MSALYKGEKGTRPPVASITSTVCQDLMDIAGIFFPQAHLDSNAMAELALAGHETIGFDTVMPEYSVHQEAAALGCDVDWGNRDMMPDSRNFPHEDFSDTRKAIYTCGSRCPIYLATPCRWKGCCCW